MANDLLVEIDDDLLAAYHAAAKRNGRSLEAELIAAFERERPFAPPSRKSREELGELARRLRAMTTYDNTSSERIIRRDRDRERDG